MILGGSGAGAGYYISTKIGPTELPQAVAAFHSLVGVAAAATAVGDFMVHDMAHATTFHNLSTYLGAWMGSITATGACDNLIKPYPTLPNPTLPHPTLSPSLGLFYSSIFPYFPLFSPLPVQCLTYQTTILILSPPSNRFRHCLRQALRTT